MKKIIYLVMEMQYGGEYTVHSAWSNEEDAKKAERKLWLNRDPARIDEIELNP